MPPQRQNPDARLALGRHTITGVVILGAGSHGRDVECLMSNEVRFLDDNNAKFFPTHYPLPDGWLYLIGVWDPHVRASLDRPDDQAAVIQSPSAQVGTT